MANWVDTAQTEGESFNVPEIAQEIANAINALDAHWQQAVEEADGDKKKAAKLAFDPNNPTTGPLFGALWEVAFPRKQPPPLPYAPKYPHPVQEQIFARLKSNHPTVIDKMREIGHFSEWEMEKGFAKNAMQRMDALEDLLKLSFRELADQNKINDLKWQLCLRRGGEWAQGWDTPEDWEPEAWNDPKRKPSLQNLTRRLNLFRHLSRPDNEGERQKFGECLADYTRIKTAAFERLTKDFPYPTYKNMEHLESCMLDMCDGMQERMKGGVHLVLEGGAIPFSAIYSSISRLDAEVIVTNSDEEAHTIATEFVQQLERIGVLVKGKVKTMQVDPLAPEFAEVDWSRHSESGKHPYAATICQRVAGAENIGKIMDVVVNQHKIDPVITRDAHGLVKLLYEPINPGKFASTAQQQLLTVPIHSAPEAEEEGNAVVLNPHFMNYNTSRVFSSQHPLQRGDDVSRKQAELTAAYGHVFTDPGKRRSLQ